MVKTVEGSGRSKVTFEVDNDRLETVVGLLIRETTNFCVTGIEEGRAAKQPKRLDHPISDKFKIVAEDVVQLMKQNPQETYHYDQLGFLMPKHGYKPSTISAVLTYLIHDRKVVRAGRGMYRLAQ